MSKEATLGYSATLTGFSDVRMSAEVNELFTALAQVQSELKHASKSSDNSFFKSSYADLAEVLNTGREVAANHGISVVQFPVGSAGLVTILGHKSGQWLQARMDMTPENNKPQTIGSCITYARRYAYAAVLGIAQDDDDGNAASGTEKKSSGSTKTSGGSMAATRTKKTYTKKSSGSPLKSLNQ